MNEQRVLVRCDWQEEHRGIPGVDNLAGDDGYVVTCDREADRKIVTKSDYLVGLIDSVGGWEAFYAEEDDPPEDPGEEAWGVETQYVCEGHAILLREHLDEWADLLGLALLSDEPLS